MKYIKLIIFLLFFFGSVTTGFCFDTKLPVLIKNNGDNSTPMIFHITGDGGMVRFDMKMLDEYTANGFSYIALNSLKYFMEKKTPEMVASDVNPLVQHFFGEWHKKELVLIGFSFGAEIIPFLSMRLPSQLSESLKLVVLLTPSETSDFKIKIRDMIGLDKKDEPYNVVEETAKIKTVRILSVFGQKEKPVFHQPVQPNLRILFIDGGHGFKDSKEVFDLILKELKN